MGGVGDLDVLRDSGEARDVGLHILHGLRGDEPGESIRRVQLFAERDRDRR